MNLIIEMYSFIVYIDHLVVYTAMLSEWGCQMIFFLLHFSYDQTTYVCIIRGLSSMEGHDYYDEAFVRGDCISIMVAHSYPIQNSGCIIAGRASPFQNSGPTFMVLFRGATP